MHGPASHSRYQDAHKPLDPSAPPSWLRPLSLRWVDLSLEYFGAAARRVPKLGAPQLRTSEWLQAWSDVIYSQRTLAALREIGVTAVCIHCDDGLGRVAQADDFRHAQQFARVCRDSGLRVFARIEAGALYYETLLTDRPGLAAWAQRDPRGDIRTVDGGIPAWRPCYRSPGFLEFLKDSVSVACQRLDPDGICLADFGPHHCHCERCQRAFRRLLMQRYADSKHALGLPSFDHVRLPAESFSGDPLHAEAAWFRVRTICGALAEIRIHLRSIDSRVALWAEPKLGLEACSRSAFAEVCSTLDVVTCTEECATLGTPSLADLADRWLTGHVFRTLVYARRAVVDSNVSPQQQLATSLGGPMAFGGHVMANEQCLRSAAEGADGSLAALSPRFASDEVMRSVWAQMLDFAARHEHYHHGAERLAEVALVFSRADIASGTNQQIESRETLRALLEAGMPVDVVPVEFLAPGRHKLAVVAGQTRVTDGESEAICRQAEQGMAVLLVGHAGACDAWGRRRVGSAFASIRTLPHVRWLAFLSNENPETWRTRLAEIARHLLPHPPLVSLTGGPTRRAPVYVCAFRLPTGQTAFHLLNASGPPVEGLRLHVRADISPSHHAAWHQPEGADVLLDCRLEDGFVVTALPVLHTYGLVVIS